MWVVNRDTNKWTESIDNNSVIDFESYKQELQSIRFYQKCLSGSTYVATGNTEDLYDILGEYKPRSYRYGESYSQYSVPGTQYPDDILINSDLSGTFSATEFRDKFLSEYGLTLKNLFTPERLIKDQGKNILYVDVATTESITNIGQYSPNLVIDDIRLKEGHRVLVKDQFTEVTLDNSIAPDDYFIGFYELVSEGSTQSVWREPTQENGIYTYINRTLVRTEDLDIYENLVRYSVCVKLGTSNRELQFNLDRLRTGFFPVYGDDDPVYFAQTKNYVLRNRVDYNNLYEILLNFTAKYGPEEYFSDGVTYSIPERTITLGEFGQIFITQEGETIIVNNKFKTNLRSLDQTTTHYWICGDDGILLKIRKLDLFIERVYIGVETQFNSINFFNDLRGVVVGRFNQIWITSNSGRDWERLNFSAFDGFNFNTVQFANIDTFYVGGDNGVFIEFKVSAGEWTAFKRRISRFEMSLDDEWVLVDDITSIQYFTYSSPYVAIGARNDNIYLYDIQNSISSFSFLYIDGGMGVGDVTSIEYGPTGSIYFSTFNSIYEFSPFGITPSVFNIINSTFSVFSYQSGINSIYNYNDVELIATGGNSNWITINFTNSGFSDVYNDGDRQEFFGRLKPRLLFMNYDIGSKLYWFDDYRQYRIPERLILPIQDFLSSSIVQFETISGQVSWLDYWRDRMKTFPYAGGNMSDGNSVFINFQFRQDDINSGTFSYTSSDVTATYSISVQPIIYPSRFRDSSETLLGIAPPSTDLYFWEYLGVWRNPGIQVGDVIEIKSDIVDGKFVINRVHSSGDWGWFFTDFNQNIVKNLSESQGNITVRNLNVYNSISEELFIYNIKNHYIGYAYDIDYDYSFPSNFEIFGKYSRYSAYYNLQTDVIVDSATYSLEYPEGFLNFGYTPDYNLYSYLSFIDPVTFDSSKEYSSLPVYENIPVSSVGIYIDDGIPDHNKLRFSEDLRNEWESLQLWTFVDIETQFLSNPPNPPETKERLIIKKKYIDNTFPDYPLVVEFHDKINQTSWVGSDPTSVSIRTRRNILQISEDLRYLNNFHRPQDSVTEVYDFDTSSTIASTFSNFDTKINSKIPLDSYTKALLSDSQTVRALTGIIYTDYKNELAMQVTKLDREFDYEVIGASGSQIEIQFDHELEVGESVLLYFSGTQSLYTSPEVLGIHPVTQIPNTNSFEIGDSLDIDLQSGLRVSWTKRDPFLNFQPIDIFDQGIGDKKIKQAVEILPENYDIEGRTYFLQNVNYNKFRYRLIDGLDLEYLTKNFEWVLEAEIRDAVIGMDPESKQLIWYKGIWECGRWFGGKWISGTWKSGDWYEGTWASKVVTDNYLTVKFDPTGSSNISSSTWFGGRWFGGYWDGGTWYDGRWYGGTWNSGRWFDGTWNDGDWNNGEFTSGIWVLGLWKNGIFNTNNGPSFWLDGKFYGGDFENGIWYNGEFKRISTSLNSRFGVNSSNTRNSNWLGGNFISGEFHSLLNLDDSGNPDISDIHKYSNWYTGFFSGDFYGGNVFNINFNSGVWHGGILNDIDIVGINSTGSSNYFLLEGVWRFNTGDVFYVVDDQLGGTYSAFGTTENPIKYKVIYALVDETLNKTELTVDIDLEDILIVDTGSTPINTNLKIVSKFTNAIWNTGIWFNGVFESGNFNGGMWYNGNFSGTWG